MKLSPQSTKLSTYFLLFIGVFVFATTASAPRVFASVIFSQTDDSSQMTGNGTGGPYEFKAYSVNSGSLNMGSITLKLNMNGCSVGGEYALNVSNGQGTTIYPYLSTGAYDIDKVSCDGTSNVFYKTFYFAISGGYGSPSVTNGYAMPDTCGAPFTGGGLWCPYSFNFFENINGGNNILVKGASVSIPYYVIDTDYTSAPPDTSTRFIDVTPVDGDTVSSTTPVTVGSHLYINDSDYNSDQYLSITFQNDTVSNIGGSALDAWNSAWGTGSTGGFAEIRIPLSTGDNDVSTTTTNFVRDGRVTATYAIKSPTFWSSLWVVGGLFSGNTVISTTTQFIVGEKTQFDEAIDAGDNGLANGILFGTTTDIIGSSFNADVCTVSNFNLIGCLKGIIVPSPQAFRTMFTEAKDGFLSYFPFGYVTRFYAIVSGTATSTLPTLSLTIPNGFPSSGSTINLSPWGKLMGEGSYLATATSTQTGVTFYSSFEVYWNRFVYFVFGLGVCLRLLGMNDTVTLPFGRSRAEKEYEERQKLRNNSKRK